MSQIAEYIQGADIPDLTLRLNDSTGAGIDFGSGYTFSLKIGQPGSAAAITKTADITGSTPSPTDEDDPNVTIEWDTTGELNTLAVGTYTGQLTATRTADSKHRIFTFPLRVKPAIS